MTTRALLVVPLLAVGLLGLASLAPLSRARADDASEAALHFELGSELYGRRRYAEALDHFLAAHRLAPNASYVFNIAQTYELLGRPRDAYNWWETRLTEFALSEEDHADSTSRRDALGTRLAVIEVRSEPAGATVFIDRPELGSVGRAPRRIALEEGEHSVIGRLDDHHDATAVARAVTGSLVQTTLSLVRIEGTLVVTTTPAGASVSLEDGGRLLGTTPLEVRLPTGSHVLSIELPLHVTERRSVNITEAAPSSLRLDLVSDARTTAILSVRSSPEGAEVTLGDRVLGTTPLTLDGLPAGASRIRLSAPEHEPWSADLALEAGAATRVNASLRSAHATAADELVWVGYVAGTLVLVAAITTGIVAGALDAVVDGAPHGNPTRAERDAARNAAVAADVLGIAAALILGGSIAWDLGAAPPPASFGTIELDR